MCYVLSALEVCQNPISQLKLLGDLTRQLFHLLNELLVDSMLIFKFGLNFLSVVCLSREMEQLLVDVILEGVALSLLFAELA